MNARIHLQGAQEILTLLGLFKLLVIRIVKFVCTHCASHFPGPCTSFAALLLFPGAVGYPTAGVEVCIAETDGSALGYKPLVLGTAEGSKYLEGAQNASGELLIRGPNVFKYYWNRPQVTRDSFTKDGWFKTG